MLLERNPEPADQPRVPADRRAEPGRRAGVPPAAQHRGAARRADQRPVHRAGQRRAGALPVPRAVAAAARRLLRVRRRAARHAADRRHEPGLQGVRDRAACPRRQRRADAQRVHRRRRRAVAGRALQPVRRGGAVLPDRARARADAPTPGARPWRPMAAHVRDHDVHRWVSDQLAEITKAAAAVSRLPADRAASPCRACGGGAPCPGHWPAAAGRPRARRAPGWRTPRR